MDQALHGQRFTAMETAWDAGTCKCLELANDWMVQCRGVARAAVVPY